MAFPVSRQDNQPQDALACCEHWEMQRHNRELSKRDTAHPVILRGRGWNVRFRSILVDELKLFIWLFPRLDTVHATLTIRTKIQDDLSLFTACSTLNTISD